MSPDTELAARRSARSSMWSGMDGLLSHFILISQVTKLFLMLVFYSLHDSSRHHGDVFAEDRVFADVIKDFDAR